MTTLILDEMFIALGENVAEFMFAQWRRDWVKRRDAIPIADLIVERTPTLRIRRSRAREVGLIAEEIADRLIQSFPAEFAALEDDVPLVASEVAETFRTATLSLKSILAVDVDPRELRLALQALRPNATDALSRGGEILYELVLGECCEYVVEVVLTLPVYHTAVGQELLTRTTGISSLLHEILDTMPRRDANGPADATPGALFAQEYSRAVVRKLDNLELFGLNTPDRVREYPLSVAYISLTMSAPQRLVRASSATADVVGSPTYMRIEDALSNGSRYLIRGEAGSGKTTLLRWLAVQAARRNFAGPLGAWNRAVPFFISLRRYVDQPLPKPQDFVEALTPTLSPPPSWAESIFRLGSALVLIDGLDELPQARRREVREWITELCSIYPDASYVVTTRPPAAAVGWLSDESFDEFELQQMTLDDVRSFVAHWHAAAKAKSSIIDTDRLLDGLEVKIRDAIVDTPHLAALATTPLICAMLCALNRERTSGLPRYRTELYRTALEMLIDRRERDRQIPRELLPLELGEVQLLLQDLAYWLVVNSQAQMDKAQATDLVRRRLLSLPHVDLTPDVVVTGLMLRTGLLREPVDGAIDFVHKTFQEYFASAEIVDQNHISLLLSNAGQDSWHDVLVLTAGLATLTQREALVAGLLKRAFEDHDPRLKLAAVECLAASPYMSPELADQSREAIRSLLPPKTTEEARALATGGDDVVQFVRGYANAGAEVAAASARCLGFVGSPEAMAALADFAVEPSRVVVQALLDMWGRFDATEYAEVVLADLPIDNDTLVVRDTTLLAPSTKLNHCRRLDCRFAGYLPAESELTVTKALWSVSAYDAGQMQDLRHLGVQPHLAHLELIRARDLVELGPVINVPDLETVIIRGATKLQSIGVFSRLTSLEVEEAPQLDIGQVVRATPHLLRVSYSRGEPDDYESLDDAATLTRLEAFAELAGLTSLSLEWVRELEDINALRGLQNLESLTLRQCGLLEDIAAVGSVTKLRCLDLAGCSRLRNLPELRAMAVLKEVNLAGCVDVSDGDELQAVRTLKSLSLRGTKISDFLWLQGLHNLQKLDLAATLISDLSMLKSLGSLQELSLASCARVNDIESLIANGRLEMLDIRRCRVTNGLASLRMNRTLTRLRIDEGHAANVREIAEIPNLRQVDIEGDLANIDISPLTSKGISVAFIPKRR